ncbi:MAG: FecR domain-containing protein [Tannerella sp.]|jgi:ferric-dicitrate binding protein FerR (iron transport regulator)|nr:FecR domain-containing protein [Tannerella sp.]
MAHTGKMEELITKYFQGELSRNERLELLRSMEGDAALKAACIRHQQMLALTAFVPAGGDAEKARAGYGAFMAERRRKSARRRLMRTLRYAAAVLGLTVGTWSAAYFYFSADENADELMQSLYVPAGQRVSMTLADGTVVWLNACTRLTYPAVFRGDERHVALEGEAWFDVAKDAEKPFTVSSGNLKVRVLGTSFNMYNYPDEAFARVSLVEGSLRVSTDENEQAGVVLRPNDEATVAGRDISVAKIPNRQYFLWTKGIYSFENETFENILKKLELYYDLQIDVKDAAMLQWRYTVKFRQRDGIREILRLMRQIHKFKMTVDEENNTVTISK